MKKLLLAALLLSFWSLAVSAQEDGIEPLFYSAPHAAEIKEFVSKENNFSVSFPGVPKVSAKQAKEFTESIFSVYREGSNSVVSVWEFRNNVENRRGNISKKYRKTILNIQAPFDYLPEPEPSIVSETEIQIGKYKGKEFAYKANMEFTRVRLLFVGKRVYEIKTDVTNWRFLSRYHKNLVNDFEKETERFFSSFRLLN